MPAIDVHVTQLFAFIHDSQRECDNGDNEHGKRAALWAEYHCGKLFEASDSQLWLLMKACNEHTSGLYASNLTVQACWDADRLDIGRCKETIDPYYLGTPVAKYPEVMKAALARSRGYSYQRSRAGLQCSRAGLQ